MENQEKIISSYLSKIESLYQQIKAMTPADAQVENNKNNFVSAFDDAIKIYDQQVGRDPLLAINALAMSFKSGVEKFN
ncbi:hypothetical protein [Azonexus sp.]|uniref:hypothetical protein n=1 Tax=Azonexus sp. TaxID=1872668 RepID=UPI0039E4BA7A